MLSSVVISTAGAFFIEDTGKIYVLLLGLIYFIALLRASLNVEWVRNYLQEKNLFLGYILGARCRQGAGVAAIRWVVK